MSTIFRRNLSLKNIRRLKILLRSTNHQCVEKECRISLFRANSSFVSVPRHRYFATAALAEHKNENIEREDTIPRNLSLGDVDQALTEIDYGVRRTGRVPKRCVQDILSMIEKLGSASEVNGLYLLRSCGLMYTEKPAERVRLASVIWDKFQKLDIKMNVKHYNSLLKVFVDCDHQFLPSEFLALMESSNIEPNKATYLLLLEKYCNDGNLNGTGEILQCLKEKGLPINESVFTLLIKGHMRANDVSGAQDILEVMRANNLSPTAESYTALACGYAEKGDIDSLNSVLAEARNNMFSNKHYLDILSALCNAERVEVVNVKINELMDKMTDVSSWQHEIANAMMSLIFKGRDDISFKLLDKISTQENHFPNLFLRTLIRADVPKEKVIAYCEEITDRRLHSQIINAAKCAIDLGKTELALDMFEVLQKKGIALRTNSVHLLLSNLKNEEGIWLTLKKMHQLGVRTEFYTFFDYVLPAISVSDPEAVISKVEETGHPFQGVIDPLFEFYCSRCEFDKALYLIEKYPVRVRPTIALEKYFDFFNNIKSYSKDYLMVLNFLLKNVGVYTQAAEVALARNLATLALKKRSLFAALIRTTGGQFNQKSLEMCASILRRTDPESFRYFRRDLENFEAQSGDRKNIPRSKAEEENELKLLKEKGLPTERYLFECLNAHLKAKNITRINELTDELEKQGAEFPPTVLAILISSACENNDLEKAEKYFNVLKSSCPSFILDSLKVIDYAALLIKCSKFEDALNVIKNECQELHLFGHPEAALKKCVRQLFTIAVETGNSDLVKNLEDLLSTHAKFLPANLLYEPLVKMHIHKNDLDSALDEFEKCVKNQHVTPCLKMLMKKCILTENSTKLDFVIKTASSVVRKDMVLLELALSFFEIGRRLEAKKIMENLSDKSCCKYLEEICSQMYNQKRVLDLLYFVECLWTVDHIDRKEIVQYIVKLSSERNDSKTPKDLYNFISKTHQLDDEMKNLFLNVRSESKETVFSSAVDSEVTTFLESLKENNAAQSLKILQSMKKGAIRTVGFSDMTTFVDKLAEAKILSELELNVNAMSYLIENGNEILKPLLEKYSTAGDCDSLIEIGKVFPDFLLKKCSFNTFLSKAYINSEKHEALLSEFEKRANDFNKLFSIFAFEELLNKPDLEERIINLAKKYLEGNFSLPIAVVWAHYFTQGRFEEADAFRKSYSVPVETVDTLVLRTVRRQGNVNLGKAYLSLITNSDASKRCMEKVYGTVLDILVSKEMFDDASSLVVEAEAKDFDLQKHYRSTLLTLKNALERQKKNVPFSTPTEGSVISE